MPRIAFNTANLVAQFTHWSFKLEQWGDQEKGVIEQMDETQWKKTCKLIADAGYTAVELWIAHAHPSVMNETAAKKRRATLDAHGLTPIAMGSALTPENAQVCQWMGIPMCCGNYDAPVTLDAIRQTQRNTGIKFAFENHPQSTTQAIRDRIDNGVDHIGVAIDTGWLGTQGLDAPTAIRELGPLVRHVHIKDVQAVGGHETVPLGTGCVDLEGLFMALKEVGYAGDFSWEDEPENRNPFDIAADMRAWICERAC